MLHVLRDFPVDSMSDEFSTWAVAVSHHAYWLSEPDATFFYGTTCPAVGSRGHSVRGAVAIFIGIHAGDLCLAVDSQPPEQVV